VRLLIILLLASPVAIATAAANERTTLWDPDALSGGKGAGQYGTKNVRMTAAMALDRVATAVDGAESSHGKDTGMWRPDPSGPQGPMQVTEAAATDVGGGDRLDRPSICAFSFSRVRSDAGILSIGVLLRRGRLPHRTSLVSLFRRGCAPTLFPASLGLRQCSFMYRSKSELVGR
jgi:hypothetical protein